MRSGIDPARNTADALQLIREAAEEGAELVATPEMTTQLDRRRTSPIPAEADTLVPFRGLASELGIHILLGSTPVPDEGKLRNQSVLLSPSGISARYSKMHLFDVDVSETESWRESATYRAGDAPVVAEVGDVRLGLTICYDLRFSELFRHYARAGCQLIAVPAAFTVPTGEAHWHVLLRARAIETGAFILAPAQGGVHEDGRGTYGHSLVVDPWGGVMAELAHDEPGILLADLDLSRVADARRRIPA